MSFTAPPTVDNANRPNGPIGSGWTAFDHLGGPLEIISNQFGTTGTYRGSAYTAHVYGPAMRAAAKVANYASSEVGFWFGAQHPEDQDLLCGYLIYYDSGGELTLYRVDPGLSYEALGDPATMTLASGGTFGVESDADGTRHIFYAPPADDFDELLTIVDDTYLTSGYVGLHAGAITTKFDDLAAETVAPPPNIKAKVGGSIVEALLRVRVAGSLVVPVAFSRAPVADSFQNLANGLPGPWWTPLDPASPFNQPLPSTPVVHESSATLMANLWSKIGTSKPGNLFTETDDAHDYSHPGYYSRESDPLYEIVTSPSNDLDGDTIRFPATGQAAGGLDGHCWVVTPDGWEYALYQTVIDHGTHQLACQNVYRQRADGLGIVTPAMIDAAPGQGIGGTTASYASQRAGIIRGAELYASLTDPETAINHALFMVVKMLSDDTHYGHGVVAPNANDRGGAGSSIYPAFKGDAVPASYGLADVDLPPMGARFFLDMTAAEINALSCKVWEKAILHALRRFGGYALDTGGPGIGFMFESWRNFTALGRPNPIATVASTLGLPHSSDFGWTFLFHNGTPWTTKLKLTVS